MVGEILIVISNILGTIQEEKQQNKTKKAKNKNLLEIFNLSVLSLSLLDSRVFFILELNFSGTQVLRKQIHWTISKNTVGGWEFLYHCPFRTVQDG